MPWDRGVAVEAGAIAVRRRTDGAFEFGLMADEVGAPEASSVPNAVQEVFRLSDLVGSGSTVEGVLLPSGYGIRFDRYRYCDQAAFRLARAAAVSGSTSSFLRIFPFGLSGIISRITSVRGTLLSARCRRQNWIISASSAV